MKADRVVTENLRSMLDAGVFIDPLLVNIFYRGQSEPMWQHARAEGQRLYEAHVHLETMNFDLAETPFSPAVMHRSLAETIVSTAVAICHEGMGRLTPTREELDLAAARVKDWICLKGIAALYRLYFVVAGYDLMQPLSFHKEVRESDYLDGVRHYPYSLDALDSYLLIALAMGSVRLKKKREGRVIQLTKLGADRLSSVQEALALSGYHERRIAMSYVYQFDNIQGWDSLCEMVWPDAKRIRQEYIDWLGLCESARIFEAGCGTGALTVEHLPYPSETFDAAIASAFLHFTNPESAIGEMTRVVCKNGLVSVLQALQFDFRRPFFRDWFAPLLDLSQRNSLLNESYLPTKEQLAGWFEGAGLVDIEARPSMSKWVFDNPETVVQHLVRGVSFFRSVLVYLPWDDQRALITELVDRGRDVCNKYSLTERTIVMPSIMIRGKKPAFCS